jgi:DNA-binding winged helix-turn-helix (wHTH) protein
MFQFDSFELCQESKELRKNGLLIRLSPPPFQVSSTLLEKGGALVTRQKLHASLWSSAQTNVEFAAGVNRFIRQIRAVLNDNSEAPRHIETVPPQGYRFIALIEVAAKQSKLGRHAEKAQEVLMWHTKS